MFILAAEVLADAIRKHNNIKGILVDGQEIKIILYADDTTLILDGSRASFQNSLQILEFFRAISSLQLNYEKTEVLWIGANAGSEEKLCPEQDLRWMRDKVKTLGVWLSSDPEIMLKVNYEEKITKLKASLGCWELRRLSLLGKITVLKSLIVSQLTYILSPLPTNQCAIGEVNTLFFKFLWDGKGDEIKRDIMISDYEDGGLKMIDIRLFTEALKLSWVKKYLDKGNEAKWKLFFNVQLRDLGGDIIFKGNLHKKDILTYFKVSDVFLQEILQIWSNVIYEDNICSKKQLLSQSLWPNSLIRVNNKPIHYLLWSSQGIQNIGHLMENETRFLSFSEFKERFHIKINFLSFYGVISAVKHLVITFKNNASQESINYESFLDKFLKAKNTNKIVHRKLIEKKRKQPVNSQTKWSEDCMIEKNEPIDWKTAYGLPFKCTKISKLRVFQFKLLHRRLATNDFLKKIKLRDNDLCNFCQIEEETLIHLFWNCTVTSSSWHNFRQWLLRNESSVRSLELTPSLVIGLKTHPLFCKNFYFLFLVARLYIWTCRIQMTHPTIDTFPLFLSHYNL